MEKFDGYASSYEAHHRSSIAASGEDPSYFHDHKLACLARRHLLEGPLLDFGCGVGNLTERFVRVPDLGEVHAYDPSVASLSQARTRAPGAVFHDDPTTLPDGHFRVAVLSGVLHHVSPSDRKDVLAKVRRSLRPGGVIVVFEHNPLNPLTRRAVATCDFDDDAVLLWSWQLRGLLRDTGFAGIELDYIVFFPHQLARLRRFEPALRGLPIGAQQMAIAVR